MRVASEVIEVNREEVKAVLARKREALGEEDYQKLQDLLRAFSYLADLIGEKDTTISQLRALLMKQRTQLVNAVRGHAAEFGVITAKGTQHVAALLQRLAAEPAVPAAAQAMFGELGAALAQVSERIAEQDRKLTVLHKNNALKTFDAYGVNGVPQVVLIDRKGVIRLIRAGDVEGNAPAIESDIKKLIAEK